VVKLAPGVSVDTVNRRLGSTTGSVLLASHSVYLLRVPITQASSDAAKQAKAWVDQAKRIGDDLNHARLVEYAEPNSVADAPAGERFHYWPSGGPTCAGADPTAYLNQRAAVQLGLSTVHAHATGAGVTIAILDTGVDATNPALAPRIAAGGYDYVDDDNTPAEVRTGADLDGDGRADEGYGHGTFVAGIAALVAPGARILPERVLDPEGRGNVFTVAEAVFDAVTHGAAVINMSFGTTADIDSAVLDDAIKEANKAGVVVVAAAGNDGSTTRHYPGGAPGVVSVAALNPDGRTLAPFSAHGDWAWTSRARCPAATAPGAGRRWPPRSCPAQPPWWPPAARTPSSTGWATRCSKAPTRSPASASTTGSSTSCGGWRASDRLPEGTYRRAVARKPWVAPVPST
jgi:subtilisin family serine protease